MPTDGQADEHREANRHFPRVYVKRKVHPFTGIEAQ